MTRTITEPTYRSNQERHSVDAFHLKRALMSIRAAQHVAGELENHGYLKETERNILDMIELAEREAKRK